MLPKTSTLRQELVHDCSRRVVREVLFEAQKSHMSGREQVRKTQVLVRAKKLIKGRRPRLGRPGGLITRLN